MSRIHALRDRRAQNASHLHGNVRKQRQMRSKRRLPARNDEYMSRRWAGLVHKKSHVQTGMPRYKTTDVESLARYESIAWFADLPRSFVQDACFGCGCTKECENKGKNVCIPTYDRSFVCTCRDWGAKWSNGGPIEGMKCTNIREPLNATNQYLCLPISTPFNLAWSRDGIPNGLNASDCIQWKFDDYRTKNNYLCQSKIINHVKKLIN